MKRGVPLFSVLMLAITVGIPLIAQTMVMKANIPFDFVVGRKTLPAGEYTVSTTGGSPVLRIQGDNVHAAAVTLTLSPREVLVAGDPARYTRLEFNRYGNQYFLSEVDDGYIASGLVLPVSRLQREASKTASLQHQEIVAVLAQR